jgi:uncharacterized protein
MNMRPEQALLFDGPGQPLVGILSHAALSTETAQPASDLGVLIIVGGPQYRVGSHRQFVLLARALARQGHHVLRFDYRGMGDSAGTLHDFLQVSDDVAAAIAALQKAAPAVQRVVLWGLCDGASAALLYLHQRSDPRVAGLALLNPWVRSEASLAKTHVKHYYAERLKSGQFWQKLFSGQVAASAVSGLWRNLRLAFVPSGEQTANNSLPYQQRMAQAWLAFAGATLLMLSEKDLTAQEFVEFSKSDPLFQKALRTRPPTRVSLADADHTCSSPQAQRAAEEATASWLLTTFSHSA